MPRAAGISPGGPGDIEFGGLNNLLSFARGTTPLLLEKILGFCVGRQIRSPGPPGRFWTDLDQDETRAAGPRRRVRDGLRLSSRFQLHAGRWEAQERDGSLR